MRYSAPLLALLTAACATAAEPGASPQRTTTTVDVGTGRGSSTVQVDRYSDAGPGPVNVAATAEAVFAVLPEVLAEKGIEIGHSDPASRTVGNQRIRVSRRLGQTRLSQYLRCGETALGTPAADVNAVSLSVLSTVRPVGGGSQLQTTVQAFATAPGRPDSTPCTTTGALEQAIAQAVALRVATP
jgi:hypothetical protein